MKELPLLHRFYTPAAPLDWMKPSQREALARLCEKLEAGAYTFENVSCLCGSTSADWVAAYDRFNLPVTTLLCRQCGMLWQSPRMTAASLTSFYNNDYRPLYVGDTQANDEFFHEQVEHGKAVYTFIKPLMRLPAAPIVFDVGCGAGGMLMPFQSDGWQSFGCDIGGEYLDRGRRKGLTLVQGEASSLRGYGSPTLILLSHVLEHLPEPLKTLRELVDMLPDGGYLYIELPGVFAAHQTYGDFLVYLQNAHLYHFTRITLSRLLAEAGFRLVKGDEYIHALYQKATPLTPSQFPSVYAAARRYLVWTEVNRRLGLTRKLRALRHASIGGVKRMIGAERVRAIKERVKQL